jgi:hypothetical protein
MASGGIVTGPTDAAVGEAGAEAVFSPSMGAFTGFGDPAGYVPYAGGAAWSEFHREAFEGQMQRHPGVRWVGGDPPTTPALTVPKILWAGAKSASKFGKDVATHQAAQVLFPKEEQTDPLTARMQQHYQERHQLGIGLGLHDISGSLTEDLGGASLDNLGSTRRSTTSGTITIDHRNADSPVSSSNPRALFRNKLLKRQAQMEPAVEGPPPQAN